MTHTHSVRLFWTRDRPWQTTQNTKQKETDIHAPAGVEPAFQASEWPQTYALDRAATGIGLGVLCVVKK
jgi:hypothetical protein